MSETPTSPFASATISIYQNPDHVAGLLQQMWVQPLLTSENRDHGTDDTSAKKSETKGHGGATVGANVPLLGKVEADLSGDRGSNTESGHVQSSRTTRNFEYSQAYYLAVVRTALRDSGVLKPVTGIEDAKSLRSGDFVEYKATFRPNEINALLDILTPDLIAAVAVAHQRNQNITEMDAYLTDFEALKTFMEIAAAKQAMRGDLARAVAEAVRVDFRSEKTREFYGTIGSTKRQSVTAITICDNPHFVVDDEDRILDGEFTVLGKVTSPMTRNVPVLERNKVLDRIKPEGVDLVFDQLREGVGDQAQKIETRADNEVQLPDDMFDVALASRITGPSFKVIPIAIYT